MVHKQKSAQYCKGIEIDLSEIANMASSHSQPVAIGSKRKVTSESGEEPPSKRIRIDENLDSNICYETSDIGDCVDEDICSTRRSYHRDRALPTVEVLERHAEEVLSVTEESDIAMDHNHNRNSNGREESDSYDEEYAIIGAQRRQRLPCLDYQQYLIP